MCNENSNEYIDTFVKYGFKRHSIPKNMKDREKFEAECIYGHKVIVSRYSIRKPKGCIECKRLLHFYARFNDLRLEGCVVLSTENDYIKTTSKIEYICPLGHLAKTSANDLQQGTRCVKCRNLSMGNYLKLGIEEVKSMFENESYEIISDINNYKNVSTRFTVKCPSNHEYETSVSNFRSGYRCRTCKYINNTGENNYNWQGGTKILRESLRQYVIPWKKESIKNCNYKCILTEDSNFEVHHIINFNEILNMFFELHNIEIKKTLYEYDDEIENFITSEFPKYHDKFGLGVCLNVELHKLFHSIYSKYDNTPEQFEEFKQDYLNGKYDDVLPVNLKSTNTNKPQEKDVNHQQS